MRRGCAAVAARAASCCWFPEPVAGRDCYRAALADTLLLVPLVPGRDAHHVAHFGDAARSDDGAGSRCCARRTPKGVQAPCASSCAGAETAPTRSRSSGAIERTAVGAAAVAATAAAWTVAGRFPPGAAGLAAVVEPREFLADVMDRGIRVYSFDGRPRREV